MTTALSAIDCPTQGATAGVPTSRSISESTETATEARPTTARRTVIHIGPRSDLYRFPQHWAHAFGAGDHDGLTGLLVDDQGNTIIAGEFSETVSFGVHTRTSRGSVDVFVAKLDPAGKVLWVFTGGGPKAERTGELLFAANGDILLAGSYLLTAQFGPFSATSSRPATFVLRLSPSGQVLALHAATTVSGADSYAYGEQLAIDAKGDIYVAGSCLGANLFGSTKVWSRALTDVCLAKLALGGFAWAKAWGGDGQEFSNGLAADGQGHLMLVGQYTKASSFDSFSLPCSGPLDAYVVQVSTAGQVQWAKRFGGVGYDSATAVVFDAQQRALVAGRFQFSSTFGATTLEGGKLPSLYVMRLDAKGTPEWVVQSSQSYANIFALALEPSGSIIAAGSMTPPLAIGSNALPGKGGYSQMLAFEVTPAGQVGWALAAGANSAAAARAIAIGSRGELVLGGDFGAQAMFGPHSLASHGMVDALVWRLR